MKIAIASGKGGTGKSTVSTNFAYLLSKSNNNLALLDCDVEEPNCHIFLEPNIKYKQQVFVQTPQIDTKLCTACGRCSEVCQYNALATVKNKVLIFNELCHGCGSCFLNCPNSAINEAGREVGVLEYGEVQKFKNKFNFIHGKMRIGEAMAVPLIKSVKKYANSRKFNVQILDCPPGTSCPVITAIKGVDYVILTTEPTPFGLYDLKLATKVVRKLNLPFSIVINRSSNNDFLIEDWAKEENIKILTKIPDDRKIATAYSKGQLALEVYPEFEKFFSPLLEILKGGKQ